ncbi:MAG TPA: penicillin-binding protein 1A [Dongiaceae bacterium]|nr:penicillin-binding protein 1A [Dongiaceae bacterium]
MRFLRILGFLFVIGAILVVAGGIAGWLVMQRYTADLPDYTQLAKYDPPVVTRVLAGDGRLLAEYAIEKRVYLPIGSIPKRVINAFLAAEDKSFYSHPGIDVQGIIRAGITNLTHLGTDRRPVGASTITQQVAKNFLLGNEVSLKRKVREIILALRIEQAYSKDHILELYLNQIYLGAGNYGVTTAALNYFNKSLDDLSIAEAAYLASLPKAPNNYAIDKHPEAALARRNWVIGQMREDGYISDAEAAAATSAPLKLNPRGATEVVTSDYFAEEVRRELVARFGEDALYKGGLTVRTSLDPRLQAIADKVLHAGLMKYDREHGFRGPFTKIDASGGWPQALAAVAPPPGLYDWKLAVVLNSDAKEAKIGLGEGTEGTIPLSELTWARHVDPTTHNMGPAVHKASDVLSPGDVIAVEPVTKDSTGKDYPAETYGLRQIPEVSGAMVAMDPHTGRVLAVTGGWSFQISEFDRAIQAMRQPGSAFKPIVYTTALENGFTPSTVIMDAPIVIDQGPGLPLWRPENFEKNFLGPATLRIGLEKSRNLMTVRVAQAIGMKKVAEMAKRLGVVDNLDPVLAMALGAGETTVLRLTNAYSIIDNGGKKVSPSLIDRVQDKLGHTIFRTDNRACDGCSGITWQNQTPPKIPDTREQLIDPATAYQMVSMMQGVVQRGTGAIIGQLGRPLAGKTGTTTDSKDVWFVGYSPDLAVGCYMGYDQPRSLGGDVATGGMIIAPLFKSFIAEALKGQPNVPFRIPPGIRLVRVDLASGQRAQPGDTNVILEAFKPGTEPNGDNNQVLMGVGASASGAGDTPTPASDSSGGLY